MEEFEIVHKEHLPELLSPAGSCEALVAAIDGGADAVYFGAGDFNARMRAKNFTDKELFEALRLCNIYGIKSYVTVNTRLRDREFSDALKLVEKLYENHADALIIADVGLADIVKRYFPDFELHASTQLSGHSHLDGECFQKLGFARMVCPREMSLCEIKELVSSSPIDIEMFIHGAHCVSFSGQCMMSYAMGGRSGNRGMCAQPCRLSFDMPSVKNRYPLSLSDMCLAESIVDIIDTGVASLKIEGRQKSPRYVYGVTSVYRKLLDERRNATAEEICEMAELFNREGFTDGYLKRYYKNMLGIRKTEDIVKINNEDDFSFVKRKIPISAELKVVCGENVSLTLSGESRSETVYGSKAFENDGVGAVSREAALKNVSRLGATPFVLNEFLFESDGRAFCTLSEINMLRREACDKLLYFEKRKTVFDCDFSFSKEKTPKKKTVRTASVMSLKQVSRQALEFFDRIYIPLAEISKADGKKICVYLEPLMYDYEIEKTEKILEGYSGEVEVHGFGEAFLVKKMGLKAVASFRLNIFNSYAAKTAYNLLDSVCISPEAPLGLLSEIIGESAVIVYGRLPLMHTQRCMMSDGGKNCRFGGNGGHSNSVAEKKSLDLKFAKCDGALCRTLMCDRKGAAFPVFGLRDCSNIIYNSVPIYMADKKELLKKYPVDRHHFIFSDETADEVDKIIFAYKNGEKPSTDAIRRLK